MLVWFEAPDIDKTFTELATSDDEFTTWFRGQVGVDEVLQAVVERRGMTLLLTDPGGRAGSRASSRSARAEADADVASGRQQ